MIAGKACIYCGFDLTGVTAQDACPKCGKPAGYSLLGDHLRDVESTWLKQVVLGLDVLCGSFGVLIGLRLVTLFVLHDPFSRQVDVTLMRLILNLMGWMSFVIGVFLITRPENSGSMIALRRRMANLLFLATFLDTAVELTSRAWVWEQAELPALVAVIGLGSFASVLSQSLLWTHLRRSIIDRTPRREVARKLNAFFCISLPLFVLLSEGSLRLLKERASLGNCALLAIDVAVCGLLIIHHGFAIYLLIAVRKAIRRTVGYWDA